MRSPFVDVEARALIAGETVVAFTERHALDEGAEVPIVSSREALQEAVKPAYRRWIGSELPAGEWMGVVEAVHPAALLDPDSGDSRHIFTSPGDGDLVLLRVYRPDGEPVLSDEAFAARIASIEGALNR